MQAGKLRERVKLLKQGVNDWGEPSGYQKVAGFKASVTDISGGELLSAGVDLTKVVIEVLLRWRTDVKDELWIEWGGDRYTIDHIERDPKRRWLKLTCEAVS